MKKMKKMKKMKNLLLKIMMVTFIATIGISKVSSQFIGSTTVDQTVIEERKGNTSNYTIPGDATDEYSWQVVGGVVTSPGVGVTGSGTVVSPYVVPFTVGLQTITVQWGVDDNTITSVTGNVSVQKQVSHTSVSCPSAIQSLDIGLWSNATIKINDTDYELCSGDPTSGPITVEFTGSPNFDYKYTVTDLDGVTGTPVSVVGATTSTQTITIPTSLINTSTTVDQTYIVTITEMNDSFTGLGTITDATFTITVHPIVETGSITSSGTLTHR